MLGVGTADALGEQIKRQVELALLRNEQALGAAAAPEQGRRRPPGQPRPRPEATLPLNLSVKGPRQVDAAAP
jgi:hypothetical protein